MDRHTGGLRKLLPCGSLNHLHGAFLLGFLWPIILLYLGLSPHSVYLRILPCVHADLSAKIDLSVSSSKGDYG